MTRSTTTGTEWFAPSSRGPATAVDAVPILCLPYAGGGASAFRGWAEALAPQVEIRPVQLPGRESRWSEMPVIDPHALAQAISDSVDGDYLIYGHSMGARLGYETVRALQQTGGPLPRRLVVGGSPPPELRLDGDLKDLSRRGDAEMIARLARLGGIPAEVLDSPELIDLLLPAIRADFSWIDDYRWRPGPALRVPITVVCGRTDGVCLPPTGLGWIRHSAPGFRLRTIPGGHFFLHEQFGALGALLRAEALGTTAAARTVRDGMVQLWLADLDRLDDPAVERMTTQASPQEIARADRFVRAIDRRRFLGRRGIIRDLLCDNGYQQPGCSLPTGQHGKPYCPDGPELSWSHRDGRLLVGLSTRPLGVDLETDRSLPDVDSLAESCLHPAEKAALAKVPEHLRARELLRSWTAKEALLKLGGQGLTIDPTSLSLQQQDPAMGLIGADEHRQPAALQPTQHAPELVDCPAEVILFQLREGPGATAAQKMFTDWMLDEWPLGAAGDAADPTSTQPAGDPR